MYAPNSWLVVACAADPVMKMNQIITINFLGNKPGRPATIEGHADNYHYSKNITISWQQARPAPPDNFC